MIKKVDFMGREDDCLLNIIHQMEFRKDVVRNICYYVTEGWMYGWMDRLKDG